MSEFERRVPSCRFAEIHHGDTLQALAAREMGDANRWPELVWVNSLTHPYLTGDPGLVGPGVLLYGSLIKVPAPVGLAAGTVDDGRVYGRDCRLVGRMLSAAADGDLDIASGADNLRQQLSHAVSTPRGQATRHPNYGCMVWRLVGRVSGPTAAKLGAEYVKATLAADYRVSKVDYSRAEISGDAVHVTARAIAIEGGVVDVVVR